MSSVNCKCGIPASVRIVNKQGPTYGRKFYGCSKWTPQGRGHCGFFKWAEDQDEVTPISPPPHQRHPQAASATPSPLSHPSGHARRVTPNATATTRREGTAHFHPRQLSFIDDSEPVNRNAPPVHIHMELMDEFTFGARFVYNEHLISFIRNLQDPLRPRWDASAKVWTFQMSSYDAILEVLTQYAPVSVVVHKIPASLLANESVDTLLDGDPAAIFDKLQRLGTLWEKLYDFQRDAVRFGLRLDGRVLFGDEMGLGKTVQALTLAACYCPEDWPLLIVTPASMKLAWAEAIRFWLPPSCQPTDENLIVVKDPRSGTPKITALAQSQRASITTPPRVVIVSYDVVKKMQDVLRLLHPNTIIADESHMLKTHTSQRTQAMKPLVAASRRAIFLSGTPALSRPIELYPQLSMLRPELFGTFDEFGARYCNGYCANGFHPPAFSSAINYPGASHVSELRETLATHVMLRRIKAQVLHQLPEKIRKQFPIKAAPAALPQITAVREQMQQLESGARAGSMREGAADAQRRQLVSQLYRLTGPAKVPAALLHIQSLLARGEKVAVFAHHRAVLDALESALDAFIRRQRGENVDEDVVVVVDDDDDDDEDAEEEEEVINLVEMYNDDDDGNRAGPSMRTPQKLKQKNTTTSTATTTHKKRSRNAAADGVNQATIRIDGSVSADRRQSAVDAFQQIESIRAAVLSITAAGVGVTLTAATVVCFVELAWTPGALIQAEDRAHRLGQRGQLQVHYLVAGGTVDDLMWRSIQSKLGIVSSMMMSGSSSASQQQQGAASFGEMAVGVMKRYESLAQQQMAAINEEDQVDDEWMGLVLEEAQQRERQQRQQRQQVKEEQVIEIEDDDEDEKEEGEIFVQEARQQQLQRATRSLRRGGAAVIELSDATTVDNQADGGGGGVTVKAEKEYEDYDDEEEEEEATSKNKKSKKKKRARRQII